MIKKITPTGNLDQENDFPFVKDGDYRDAFDVTSISDGNGNTISWEPKTQPKYVLDLGSESVQVAEWKITFKDFPNETTGAQIDIYNQNGQFLNGYMIYPQSSAQLDAASVAYSLYSLVSNQTPFSGSVGSTGSRTVNISTGLSKHAFREGQAVYANYTGNPGGINGSLGYVINVAANSFTIQYPFVIAGVPIGTTGTVYNSEDIKEGATAYIDPSDNKSVLYNTFSLYQSDFKIVSSSPYVTITKTKDPIDASIVGKYTMCGGKDLLGDLFLMSTTGIYDSDSYNIISATYKSIPAYGPANGVGIVLEFDRAHNITVGESVSIYGISDYYNQFGNEWSVESIPSSTKISLYCSDSRTLSSPSVSVRANITSGNNIITLVGVNTGAFCPGQAVSAPGFAFGPQLRIVNVVNSTSLLLSSTPVSTYTSALITISGPSYASVGPITIAAGAKCYTRVKTLSQVSVITEDPSSGVIKNTSLLKTSKFNFRVSNRIHLYCEDEGFRKSLYWCDGNNKDRVLYYNQKSYVNGGFLSSNGGSYSLATIDEDTQLQVPRPNSSFVFSGVGNGGGVLKSGNYRYAIRFVTEYFATTPWSDLSNIINIYNSDPGNPSTIVGDPDGTQTSKYVSFNISNVSSIYKYYDIAYVRYSNNSYYSEAIRNSVPSSSFNFNHLGSETNVIDFNIDELNANDVFYEVSSSIDSIDNRLVRSNLKSTSISDFTSFFKTVRHEIKRVAIPNASQGNIEKNEEYRNPLNVFYKKSFVPNETYRFSARVKLKNGDILQENFWIDDITIDGSVTNPANTSDSRRDLPAFSQPGAYCVSWNDPNSNPYVYYIQFKNVNWDYIVNGKKVSDLVDQIYIDFVEMTPDYREVLATGIMTSATQSGTTVTYGNTTSNSWTGYWPGPVAGEVSFTDGTNPLGGSFQPPKFTLPNSSYNGASPSNRLGPNVIQYYTSIPNNPAASSSKAFFISSDIYHNQSSISFSSGDTIIGSQSLYGPPGYYTTYNIGSEWPSEYFEMITGGGTVTDSATLNDAQEINPFEKKTINGSSIANSIAVYQAFTNSSTSGVTWARGNTFYALPKCLAISASSNFISDSSYYFGQYFRNKNKGSKFGAKKDSKYVWTGFSLSSSNTSIDVYGDCFAQFSRVKIRNQSVVSWDGTGSPNAYWGWGSGVLFMSYNRVNTQMEYLNETVNQSITTLGIKNWLNKDYLYKYNYTNGYSNRFEIKSTRGVDTDVVRVNEFPSRICYSNLKENGSIEDPYRKFELLNFRDLNLSNGPIVHHELGNGELLTWQPKSFERQFFNSSGILQSSGGMDVVIGDSGALTRRGIQISSLGTSHKWSIAKGRSRGGDDIFAWVNTDTGDLVRFGRDGTVPVAQVQNMMSSLRNRLKYVGKEFSPSKELGIRSVWDDANKSFHFIVRSARNTHGLYNPTIPYTVPVSGDVYVYAVVSVSGSVVLKSYKLLQSNTGLLPWNSPSYWQESTDVDTFNIDYSMIKGGFQSFHTWCPKTPIQWKNTIISSTPFGVSYVGNANLFSENLLHVHNRGNTSTCYGIQTNPYITGLCVYDPNMKTTYDAIELNSSLLPTRIDFTTTQHKSYLLTTDFEQDEVHDNLWASPIKNDSTYDAVNNPTQSNEVDTSGLFGQHLLIKYSFNNTVKSKLFNFIIKMTPLSRLNNS